MIKAERYEQLKVLFDLLAGGLLMLSTVGCNDDGKQDGAAVTTHTSENAPTNAPTQEGTEPLDTDVHVGNGEDFTWGTYYPFP